eukprot:TRINITY_DN1392_c2_g1_i2.p1 TRINITY_DN1392_c2_g1~~TRINITY_DN1392_c2_g1_i2.p1  ORF type:complete len:457 (-),score=81.13 TRINITY_DN1392_c2_g1_i2:188-1534(-)
MYTVEKEREQSDDGRIKHTERVGFAYCMKLWILTLIKSLVTIILVLLVLCIYFLPALVLRGDLLEVVKRPIYKSIMSVFDRFTFFGFIVQYGVSLFGYYFCAKALFLCMLPGLIFNIFVAAFLSDRFGYVINFATTCVSIILVYRKRLPENPSKLLIEQCERKKEIAKPAGKIVALIFSLYCILRFTYPIFLNSSFQIKIAFRFVIVPIITAICSALQLHFLKSAKQKYVDFLIPVIWITNGFLKMFERIFTNNIFKSGNYLYFVATTFTAAIIEIVNHATYFHRASAFDKVSKFIGKLWKRNGRSLRTISLAPSDESQQRQVDTNNQILEVENEWLWRIRKKLIIEDISIELMMLFTVTFLLYFIHPLVDNEKIQKIPTFEICIFQLLIQIVFELFSDVFGIYWTIKRHKMDLRTSDVVIMNQWYWYWVFFILWQTLLISWYFIFYG